MSTAISVDGGVATDQVTRADGFLGDTVDTRECDAWIIGSVLSEFSEDRLKSLTVRTPWNEEHDKVDEIGRYYFVEVIFSQRRHFVVISFIVL